MTGLHETDLDRRIADWLDAGPTLLPDTTSRAIRVAVHADPRQRSHRAPWRYLDMFTLKAALSVAVIVSVLTWGAWTLRTPSADDAGTGPSVSPCAPAAHGTDQPTVSPAASPVDTTGWVRFVSPRYGYSICYPSDWTVREGTDPLPIGSTGDFGQPTNDEWDGPGTIAFTATSAPAPAGIPEADFLAQYSTHGRSMGWPAECWPLTEQEWESIVIDGHPAHVHGGYGDCDFTEVLAFVGGRLYDLQGTPNAKLLTGRIFDRGLFDAFLSTVRFDPSSADDGAAAVSASPTVTAVP